MNRYQDDVFNVCAVPYKKWLVRESSFSEAWVVVVDHVLRIVLEVSL